MIKSFDTNRTVTFTDTEDGLFLTFSEVDGRPGVTSGTLRFDSPGLRRAYAASFLAGS